jgi:transcriptional regulator with XRE-family HTH domain
MEKTNSKIILAANLKELRLKRHLIQVSLAKKAGINDNYYARVERAEVSPTVEKLEKIVKALHVKSSNVLPF